MRSIALLFIFILFTSCGNSDPVPTSAVVIDKIQTPENLKKFYGAAMKNIYVKVFYEPGAEPFYGNNSRGQPVWGLLEKNIQAVFSQRSQTVTLHIPKLLTEMTAIPVQGKPTWTADEVNTFGATLGVPANTESAAYFTIIFLNGAYKSGANISNSVLGISITGTTYIALFKDAIRLLGPSSDSLTVKFGEQATLVHELGHALGIVGNGVNPVADHHDAQNGSHCSNSSCVMYWQNEGNKDLLEFIQGLVQQGNSTLYDSQCLDDIKAYVP